MPFRFQLNESIPDSTRRLICEQISHAADHLTNHEAEIDTSIHETRKCFKKIRSVLRLVRIDLGDLYRTENAWFRDAGKRLAPYRDAAAVLEALEKLRKTMRQDIDTQNFAAAVAFFERESRQTTEQDSDLNSTIQQLVTDLESKRRQTRKWSVHTNGVATITDGLRRTYRRSRNAMRKAYADTTAENFHEWRKRIKYHWYHCCLLTNLWPNVLLPYAREIHRLADLLGDYHDLDILRDSIIRDLEPTGIGDIGNLLRLIEGRQAALRKEALPLGCRIYAERSNRFAQRLGHYWNTWREQDKIDIAQVW